MNQATEMQRFDQLGRGGDEHRTDPKSSGTERNRGEVPGWAMARPRGRRNAMAMRRYEAKRGAVISEGTEKRRKAVVEHGVDWNCFGTELSSFDRPRNGEDEGRDAGEWRGRGPRRRGMAQERSASAMPSLEKQSYGLAVRGNASDEISGEMRSGAVERHGEERQGALVKRGEAGNRRAVRRRSGERFEWPW